MSVDCSKFFFTGISRERKLRDLTDTRPTGNHLLAHRRRQTRKTYIVLVVIVDIFVIRLIMIVYHRTDTYSAVDYSGPDFC